MDDPHTPPPAAPAQPGISATPDDAVADPADGFRFDINDPSTWPDNVEVETTDEHNLTMEEVHAIYGTPSPNRLRAWDRARSHGGVCYTS